MTKYDDAEYCYLNFESDLPAEAGGTHTGMFLAWAAGKGMLAASFDAQKLASLKAREITGSQLYFGACDGKLTNADLNEFGNAFTASYYEENFVADYRREFAKDLPNAGDSTDDFCSLPDTWDNYERMARVLNQRLAHWQKSKSPSSEPAPAPQRSPTQAKPAAESGAGGGKVGPAPVVALLVGAASVIVLMLAASIVESTTLQAIAVVLGAVSAFGAYRCSLGLGKSTANARVLGVLAFVPVLGSLVCLSLVAQIFRRHRPQ